MPGNAAIQSAQIPCGWDWILCDTPTAVILYCTTPAVRLYIKSIRRYGDDSGRHAYKTIQHKQSNGMWQHILLEQICLKCISVYQVTSTRSWQVRHYLLFLPLHQTIYIKALDKQHMKWFEKNLLWFDIRWHIRIESTKMLVQEYLK